MFTDPCGRSYLRCVGILLGLKDSTKALISLGVSLMAKYSTGTVGVGGKVPHAYLGQACSCDVCTVARSSVVASLTIVV